MSSGSSLGALPPITGVRAGPTDVTLSSMTADEMQKAERKRAKAAERARLESEQALLSKKTEESKSQSQGMGLTEAEIAERKAHLQRQRELLVAAKKKEREETMKEYKAQKEAGGLPGTLQHRVSEKQKQVADEVLEAVKAVKLTSADGSDQGGMSDQELKRMEMRRALAQRVKEDLAV